jgi:hypothetical protein
MTSQEISKAGSAADRLTAWVLLIFCAIAAAFL